MNFTGNQRRLYLLALALLTASIALACTWGLWHRADVSASQTLTFPEGGAASAPSPAATEVSAAPTAGEAPSAAQARGTVDTVVYYRDNYGYLVPVMCSVPAEEGIAKATLSLMVQSPANDMQAARLGLRTVLPENTSIDLDISGGTARVDLSREAANLPDAAAESGMVSAVVQALTEFPTVERVEFLFGGQRLEKLKNGVSVSGQFTRGDINLETASAVSADSRPVLLYFPSDDASVLVPVTRMVRSNADVNTAVLELTKGPSSSSVLEGVIPAGCGLVDVKVEDGTARLYFTGEFIQLAQNSDGGRMALKALVLTCTQFEGIDAVEIYVDGQLYDPGESTLAVPTFVNVADDIIYDYIQTQSALLFDFD